VKGSGLLVEVQREKKNVATSRFVAKRETNTKRRRQFSVERAASGQEKRPSVWEAKARREGPTDRLARRLERANDLIKKKKNLMGRARVVTTRFARRREKKFDGAKDYGGGG